MMADARCWVCGAAALVLCLGVGQRGDGADAPAMRPVARTMQEELKRRQASRARHEAERRALAEAAQNVSKAQHVRMMEELGQYVGQVVEVVGRVEADRKCHVRLGGTDVPVDGFDSFSGPRGEYNVALTALVGVRPPPEEFVLAMVSEERRREIQAEVGTLFLAMLRCRPDPPEPVVARPTTEAECREALGKVVELTGTVEHSTPGPQDWFSQDWFYVNTGSVRVRLLDIGPLQHALPAKVRFTGKLGYREPETIPREIVDQLQYQTAEAHRAMMARMQNVDRIVTTPGGLVLSGTWWEPVGVEQPATAEAKP